uniref:FAR1 domain-containing protein n=1 Tax=Chenopodium quinoa TaxID=63459 RepID=A0A803LLT9_CHEQI
MARKMLILDDPFLQNCIEVECGSVGGHWAAGENVFVAEEVEGIPAEGVADVENLEEEVVIVGGSEEQDGAGEDEAHAAAIEELLKEVNVGEESYKTPTKGKSNVDISVEVEEFANVEVSLPPPTVGMVFDSWQKIDEYFRNYGKQEGFGVVRSCGATIGKGANAKDKRNVTWTCECYGLPGRKRKKTGSTFVNDSQICEEVFGSLCSKASTFLESTTLVMQALQLLELQVDEKIAVVSKKGLVGTPSSVCREKGNDTTPSTQRQGSCDPQNGVEEDPPISSKGGYFPYSNFPVANAPYPIPVCGWRSPVSPASAASRQGGFVPILPRPRPPATPPPTPGASCRS